MERRRLIDWFALPASALAALLVGAVMIAALGANPLTGYHALVTGAFGGSYALGARRSRRCRCCSSASASASPSGPTSSTSAVRARSRWAASPATAIALALPDLPSAVLIPLVLLAGAVGGGVWGAIPGAFKAYFNVNEILSTIMLNLVAVQLMNYLLAGPMVDQTAGSVGGLIPQTRLLSKHSWLPILVPGTQLHLGVVDRGARRRRRLLSCSGAPASASASARSASRATRRPTPACPCGARSRWR